MQISAFDYFSITSRTVTDEGYLVAPGQLARTGVQEYRAMELGLDGNPMRKVRLYRPPEEVFDTASMASFEHKPVTIEHPAQGVTAATWRELAVGDVHGVTRAGEFMTATLTLKSKDAIAALDAGKRELSNGYTFELDLTPGTAPDGSAYDGVQRKIRGNHIALVDSARCGSACRVADSNPGDTPTMSTQKITVDGIPLEVSDTAAAVLGKMQTQIADLTANLKMANDALAKAVTPEQHATVVAELATARKDVMTPAARDAMVGQWAQLLTDAKRLAPSVTTDGKTCHAIRKEALAAVAAADAGVKASIDAVLGGVAIEAAGEDLTATAWRVALTATPAPTNDSALHQHVGDAFLAPSKPGTQQAQPAGRAAMMRNMQTAS